MNLQVTCPHCQQLITAPVNEEVECPLCHGRVIAEPPLARAPSTPKWQMRFIMLVTLPLLAFIAWGAVSNKPRASAAPSAIHSAAPVSGISHAELQGIIADVYKVETSRFINPDLMWITLPAGSDPQKTCQAIANLWAHRSGLDYVRVECWNGSQRLGQGTVQYGQMRTP